jgi:Na+-transporting methylmalonyl-CoA/oxaloacetate decarboxylase gamma subunit
MNTLFLLKASLGERLSEGLIALLAGMGTVFAILILISIVISLFKYMKTGEITHVHDDRKFNAFVEDLPATEEVQDDLELIAVIMAAIAASLETTTDQLQVKSFRRINKNGFSR